ncbi:MAG TPA: dihydrolipoamide acetyltransferase family protein [Solirubrobacterales bacterium]|nr:dihydrolipoamide acetyltransferase family protein [Solirubrobacterales bacterium]
MVAGGQLHPERGAGPQRSRGGTAVLTAPHLIRLPDLGEGLTGAEVVRWLVGEGDSVARDQALVEVETDKAVVQIPSPVEGTVTGLLVAEGARASVGDALAEIAAERNGRTAGPRALPRVRALASELGVDLAAVRPARGVVTEDDVRAAAETSGREEPNLHGEVAARGDADEPVPLRGVRREIAEHMTDAAAVPTVTVVEECDFSALADAAPYVRAAAVIAATAEALDAHPELNATLQSGELMRHERRDIGYAVQGAHGLVVPVIRDAAGRSADQLAPEVERLVEAGRAGTLAADELRGGTFTITDARRLGGLFATPLLNTPQVGILGVHRVAERPVVRDGEVVARPVALLSVGFDHRALDGAAAAAFLLDVVELIESWRLA